MRDPREGLTSRGFITTGASRERVAPAYEPVLRVAGSMLEALDDAEASELHLYGSVATGQAVLGRSDVDLLAVGVPAERAAAMGRDLSRQLAGLGRGVEVGAARHEDFLGPHDAAYGLRVFLRHYCVPLVGPDAHRSPAPFRGDVAAARGFNGDLAEHLARWRTQTPTATLGRQVARKTLLAVAGLVSIHDTTWTTDRASAATRWGALRPGWAASLETLLSWSERAPVTASDVVEVLLEGAVVDGVLEEFASSIGLWRTSGGLG